MSIAEDDIERIRSTVSLAEVVGDTVALRRSGSRFVGLCPFHAEKSPSFSVNDELGFYFCFGCQAKGDVITFLRETQHLAFVEAVEELAKRAGIELQRDSPHESGQRRRKVLLTEGMGRAVDWYHERLLQAPDAASARGYLRSRGYDAETVRRFKLGWAPDDWDALSRSIGLAPDVLRETGLAFENRRGRLQDSFRGRVLFPIFDVRGDPVALGGRILPGATRPDGTADGPKYKNSAATAIYDKGETLYGLHWAKAAIVERAEVVVCEGYTDVIGFAAAGVTQAVATCGTALTDRHVATLTNFARRVVLAFDADAAGQGAAARFYEWERRYSLDVFVAALPAGGDPAELGARDAEALRRAVVEAKRFLAFRLDRVLTPAALSTPEARARAADEAAGLIAEHPNPIVREQYAGPLADRLQIDPAHLLGGRRRRGVEPERRAPAPKDSAALMALRLAVHQPEEVADRLDEVLFTDPVHVAAYRALAGAATLPEALADAQPEAGELLARLAVEEVDVDADDVLGLLAADVGGRALRAAGARLQSAWSTEEVHEHSWLTALLGRVRDPAESRAAVGELVAFLSERDEEDT